MDQSTHTSDRDRVIAELIQKRDYRQAIALCTRDHEATLTELCVNELGDNDEAREAVQEILVAAFDAMPTFDAKQSVQTWLLGIAHHICARRSEARAPKPEPTALEKRVLAALDARGAATSKVREGDAKPGRSEAFSATSTASPTAAPANTSAAPAKLITPAEINLDIPINNLGHTDPALGTQTTTRKQPTLWIAFAGGLALIAFVIGVMQRDKNAQPTVVDATSIEGALNANILRIQRAANGAGGAEIRNDGKSAYVSAQSGASLGAGGAIRTDARTRVDLALSDGSMINLGHDTELALDPEAPRRVHIHHGELVANIAHIDGAKPAEVITPAGRIEVLGTKLFVQAQAASTMVRVTQGVVRLIDNTGGQSEVRPGQEGWLVASGPASVIPAIDLASSVAWSNDDSDDTQLRGLGELRARRPGERDDKDRPLLLAEHKVDVKIAGNLARTEVEETFRNDGPHELEGIYRFPLPADAQIASLSLLVDGQWIDGGFVERDRAKKIWRGVIRNATPEQQRQQEEFIWVPGPWRDPALLEWQKGGQFELRIFPIPAHGARSVRIAYTELLPIYGRGRRYTYPLPHSADPKLSVGRFDANVRLIGADPSSEPTHSYAMRRAQQDGGLALNYGETAFAPAGDLTIDFRTKDGDAELRSYAFAGAATTPPPAASREGDPEAQREHQRLHADDSAYVTFMLRPSLPMTQVLTPRDYALVIDASQSMVGERFNRGAHLIERIVREMDPRDRVLVLACDSTCRVMSEEPMHASQAHAQNVASWLTSQEAAGGSDSVAALREAAALVGRHRGEREAHVVYVSDGQATTGHRRAAAIANDTAALAAANHVAFTAIGVGSDADSLVLSAIARAGGGHYLPYRPGETLSVVALRMLESTYGAVLQNPWLELPEGIDQVAPGALPTIRSGEEVVVVGRMRRANVTGEAVLHGQLAGEPYEKRIPLRVESSNDKGNAFVPTLWAQKTIEKLELDGRGEDVPRIVALSKAFAVMSRHTSLLVLESEAMFKAFGVDRASPAATWTGDEEAEGESSDAQLDLAANMPADALNDLAGAAAVSGSADTLGTSGRGAGGGGNAQGIGGLSRSSSGAREEAKTAEPMRRRAPAGPMPTTTSAPAPARRPMAASESFEGERDDAPRPSSPAAAPMPEIAQPARAMPIMIEPPRQQGRWMRKVWMRYADVNSNTAPRSADVQAVAVAESALQEQPDSRDRHRNLVRALAKAGELDQAANVAAQWLERDKLDAEALTYLSDVIGRQGDRERAVRLLSGVVDLRADDPVLHERLAKAFDRAGNQLRACAHRVSLAEIKPDAVDVVASAVRCERSLGHQSGARSVLDNLKDASLRNKVEQAAASGTSDSTPRGELLVTGRWNARADLDISLITNEGTRISWMGGRVSAVGADASALDRETVGLSRLNAGTYRIEISRTDVSEHGSITGTLDVRALDQRRSLPFRLDGARTVVGTVVITRQSMLVPSSAPQRPGDPSIVMGF